MFWSLIGPWSNLYMHISINRMSAWHCCIKHLTVLSLKTTTWRERYRCHVLKNYFVEKMCLLTTDGAPVMTGSTGCCNLHGRCDPVGLLLSHKFTFYFSFQIGVARLQALRLSSDQRSAGGSSSCGLGVTAVRSKCFLRNNNADRQMHIFESDSQTLPNTFQWRLPRRFFVL